ncbi:MAG: response regulator transcription factor [Saprospiraceae bacterium]|nr:response regulator transcription factor [Saprospiraceae bacterium]
MPETSIAPITIGLADDQELFIESLSALLSNARDVVEVVWSARSAEDALELIRQQPPDVVLMDYFFRGRPLDGGEACRIIREEFPEVGVLMLSVSCDMSVIRESLQKGALGYVSKEVSKNELIQAIQQVANGQYYLDRTALRELIQAVVQPAPKMPKSVLTPRELEVARVYVKGAAIREIAGALFISEDTVESHIKNIRAKTGASSRYEVGEFLKQHDLW